MEHIRIPKVSRLVKRIVLVKMSKISDYTDDGVYGDFKQDFNLVTPEEIQYFSELLINDFEELNRRSCILGISLPQTIVDFKKWIEENLITECGVNVPMFYKGILVVKKVENVRMIDRFNSKNSIVGTLYLTATHLIFVDPEANKETWILHMHISSVEKQPLTTTGSPLLIRCKTFLSVTFVIGKESQCHDVYTTLTKLYQPVNFQNLYCFQYTSSSEELQKSSGWDFFKLENEFKRMRVPNDEWQLCKMNKSYELCDTYPNQIYVPNSVDKTILLGSSRFRSKGRLPTLTYLHPNKASICRCSQPLAGFSARCVEDEQMLQEIKKTNPNSNILYVVDTRPKMNALANRAAGKGYENELFYENTKFHFLGIENIHVMRASLQKLIEACEQKSMSGFLSALESSGWLKHIRAMLDTSYFIANAVYKGISVVVHCSDGWDRTSQVCSLASLMLDPFYRTIKGFQALIEKDWLSFGHKFSERCGHLSTDPKEVSPVFTQFLDSVWQMMQQRVDAFEFNERFLLILHDHVMSCQFGTFIGNCEKDRIDLKLAEKTFSLWGFMANHMNEYQNPLYKPGEIDDIIVPNLAPQCIKFWRAMYSRYDSGVHPREDVGDFLLASKDHSSSLEDHVQHLTKRIGNLKNLISKSAKKLQTNGATLLQSATGNRTDNKFNYDNKKLSELQSADHDHPLKVSENFSFSNLTVSDFPPPEVDQISSEVNSVALDWKSLRSATVCSCSTPFSQEMKKTHCWRCGDIFCTRCIDKSIPLPGHHSKKLVPVCRSCFKLVTTVSP